MTTEEMIGPPDQDPIGSLVADATRRAAWAITRVFETGAAAATAAAYATVAVLPDGAGVSYGMHQATEASGTLRAVLVEYSARTTITTRAALRTYLNQLDEHVSLSADEGFKRTLRDLGADPKMQAAQDAVFRRLYWDPIVAYGERIGLDLPLSYAHLYDLAIHSGHPGRLNRLRRTFAACPPSTGGDEREWSRAVMDARRLGLSNHPKRLIQRLAWRPSVYIEIASGGADSWALKPPIAATFGPHGRVIITENDLS